MKSIQIFSVLAFFAMVSTGLVAQEWHHFKSEKYKCEIDFPKEPEEIVQTVDTEYGPLTIVTFMHEVKDEDDENLVYTVSHTAYPPSLLDVSDKKLMDTFFKNSIEGAISNVQGKLISGTEIELDGNPGHHVKVDFKDGLAVINMQMFVVGDVMYMNQVIALTSLDDNKTMKAYFDSFKLLNE